MHFHRENLMLFLVCTLLSWSVLMGITSSIFSYGLLSGHKKKELSQVEIAKIEMDLDKLVHESLLQMYQDLCGQRPFHETCSKIPTGTQEFLLAR